MRQQNWGEEPLTDNETRILIEHVISIVTTRSTEAFVGALSRLQELSEADQLIICQVATRGGRPHIEQIYNYSFEPCWIETYVANSYAYIDPVLKRAQQLQHAFWWDLSRDESSSGDLRMFVDSAMDCGLRWGITCALPSPGKAPQQFIVGTLGNVAPHRYGAAKNALTALLPAFQMSFAACSSNLPRLTDAEREVLAWASKGKGVWEISVLLGVSQSTVKFHLQNIYRKFDVNNRAHAILKASQAGLL